MSPLEVPTRKPLVLIQGRYRNVVSKWSRGVWIEDPPLRKKE